MGKELSPDELNGLKRFGIHLQPSYIVNLKIKKASVMLDIKLIRENPDLLKKACIDKNFDPLLVDQTLDLDQAIKPLKQEVESLQAERNALSKKIPKATVETRKSMVEKVQKLKTSLESKQIELKQKTLAYDDLMFMLPAPARDDVPVGESDAENVEVKKWGTVPQFDFEPLDHISLGEKLGLIDFARGVKLAGSRSYVLTGKGALLEQALLRFTFDKLVAKGYRPLSVPVLVSEDAMIGTGYFPTGRDQAYYVEKDELALVGTSEVSLTSFHRNETLDTSKLPMRMFAQSTCFRREAGSHGKDTKGLYRVHQFQKVEQVIIAPADRDISEKMHDELLNNSEEILQDLGLPYRVVYVCTGDLGQGQVRKHDIETWMPSRDSYGETHSCSTFHDFQARRLKMKYKEGDTRKFCYTLNNTAIATPRVMIPLIENFQTKTGNIKVPKCLQAYMGGIEEI